MLLVHNPLKSQVLIKNEEVSGEPCLFDHVVVIHDPSIIGMYVFGNDVYSESFGVFLSFGLIYPKTIIKIFIKVQAKT